MSRKVVLVGAFLTVLPVLLVSVKVRGNDPPKKELVVSSSPFDDDAGAKPSEQQSVRKPQVDNPFGDAGAKPNESTPQRVRGRRLRDPLAQKVDIGKPNPSKTDGLNTDAQDVACDEAAERTIRAALKQPTQIEFVDTPLRDVIDYLKSKHQIEIQLDTAAMKDAGADPDAQITKNIKGISLRSALKLLLEESKLMYVVHNGVLLITTPEKASSDEYMDTRIYPVTDLVVAERDGGVNLQPLEDMLLNTVPTKTWVDNGGTGTISHVIVGNCVVLVISQTDGVHEEIENLVEKLRKAAGLKTAAQQVAAEDMKGPKNPSDANPKPKVMHLLQRQNANPIFSGGGVLADTWQKAFEREMMADAQQKENLEKRIESLNSRIAATENLLSQPGDVGKHATLMQEYSAEVKALKDLFDARATLRSPSAMQRGLGMVPAPVPPPVQGSGGGGGYF
jgi:hypothetical protein